MIVSFHTEKNTGADLGFGHGGGGGWGCILEIGKEKGNELAVNLCNNSGVSWGVKPRNP